MTVKITTKWILVAAVIGFFCALDTFEADAQRDGVISGKRRILMHNGLERSYLIRTPGESPGRAAGLPLVLVLHGGGGNAFNAERMTGFTEKAAMEGFIVAYPEGTGRENAIFKRLTWNAGHCCGPAMRNQVDDIGFISALIDKLIASYPLDPKRIYVTGLSNGGMMSHSLGIALANKISAIAPVIATVFGDEMRPRLPVSAVMINGMLDKAVPYKGGPTGSRFPGAWDGTPSKPAQNQAEFWADANACENMPLEYDQGKHIHKKYRCPDGRGVEIYLIKDNGHAWPGGQQGGRWGDTPSQSLNATDVIWEFFKAHSRQP